jgi:hypothetical protein
MQAAPLTAAILSRARSSVAPLPLDSFTTVARAYSIARRLRTAYTGSLVRARRSADSAERDFGYTATNELDSAALVGFCGFNSVPNSETITAVAGWTLTGVTTATNGTAGGDNIWRVTEDATTNKHRINTATITATAGQSLVVSVEVKAAGASLFQILFGSAIAVSRANFDLDTLTTNFTTTTATITDIGDGWRRITAGVTVSTGNAQIFLQFIQSITDIRDPLGYAGSTSRAVDVRRFQVQVGATASGYCPTFGTAVTAVQDAFVTTIYDQSGTADNAVQATASLQPRIVTAGALSRTLGGKPTALSDGVDDTMTFGITGLTAYPLSFALTISRTATPSKGAWLKIGGTGPSTGVGIGMGSSTVIAVGANIVGLKEAVTWVRTSTAVVAEAVVSVLQPEGTTETSIRQNGTAATITAGATSAPIAPTGGGALFGHTLSAELRYAQDGIMECVVWNALLSAAEVNTYEKNVGTFTGITVA